MIRTLITLQQQNISIDLPPDYVGRKMEVIAFTIEEEGAIQTTTQNKSLEAQFIKGANRLIFNHCVEGLQ